MGDEQRLLRPSGCPAERTARIGIDVGPLGVRSGGIRRYVENLVAGLMEQGDDHELVLCGAVGAARMPVPSNRIGWDRNGFLLERWAKQIHPVGAGRLDLFHATNYLPPLLASMPTVLTVHDLSVHLLPENHGWKRRLRHRLLPSTCRRASRVIADSLNTKIDLVRLFRIPEDKIDVIYLAVDDSFRPVSDPARREEVLRRYGLPEEFVLFVGSIDPRKNLAALVEAHARLWREGCRLPLVLAGSGVEPVVAKLSAAAQAAGLRLGSGLLMPGHVADADLPALYTQTRLFVYPSLYEGFGLPPLEAMACGAPVLVPDNSAFRELYRGTPMLFDMEEKDGLLNAMRAALDDPERRDQLIEQGLKHAEARSWDNVVAETLVCYRRALETG